MRILIAPDKFAGTLTATEAADAIAAGWSTVRPSDVVDIAPLADGGEGTVNILTQHRPDATAHHVTIRDQLDQQRQVTATRLEFGNGSIVIEAAQACGISQLTRNERNPYVLSSRGLGDLISSTPNYATVIVGLGGTSTVDGGAGMLQALGHELLDRCGQPIGPGLDGLEELTTIRPRSSAQQRNIIVASDVNTPLTGSGGAAHTFGPQKGLAPGELAQADNVLHHFATLTSATLATSITETTLGGGAAGGIGFALAAYEHAPITSGSETITRLLELPNKIVDADLVITGEGRVDASTTHGKGPWYIAELAHRTHNTPVAVIAGSIDPTMHDNFDYTAELGPNGLTNARQLVEQRAAELAATFSQSASSPDATQSSERKPLRQ